MKSTVTLLFTGIMFCTFTGCRKKTIPAESPHKEVVNKKVSTPKAATNSRVIKTPTPNMILVNDKVATKTFDGRLYYDLDGKRYWRNNKDGKYYLFNKSMTGNPDFK